jgi:hypothetical protein
MGYLIVAVIAAMASALAAYDATASLAVAFVSYAAAGSLTLLLALAAAAVLPERIDAED